MNQKQSRLYQFILCLVGILAIFIESLCIDVFAQDTFLSMALLNLVLIHIATFYTSNLCEKFENGGLSDEFKALTHYMMQYFLLITMLLFLDKSMTLESRAKLIYMIMLHAVFIYIVHKTSKNLRQKLLKNPRNLMKVMLVTTTDRLDKIAKRMQKKGDWNGEITSILILDVVDRSQVTLPDYFDGVSRVDMRSFEKFITRQVIDEAFIHVDSSFNYLVSELLPVFEESGIDVNVNISAFDIASNAKRKVTELGAFSVIKFSTKFYDTESIIWKRLIDITFGIVGLVLTVPIALILIPLIKFDSKGPAIFAQNRVGKNGRIFKFYKFRSMVIDAEAQKEALMAQNEMDGLMFKMEADPRITRIGKFIRKTSLDELPQFFNILIGDMSLVGTRPPTVEEYEQYTRQQKKRLSLKPGITGLWQVSGRSEITDFNEVVKLDIDYIDHWSLALDMKIILKTIKIVLLGRGAK